MQSKAEEAKLDNSLDALIQRSNDIKASLNQFLWKLDHDCEALTWPSVLDNFALLSSQITSFQKLLSSDRTAQLRNYVFVPVHLNMDRDAELEKLTEGRVAAFNHEIVPNYLRTKPEMDVEKKIKTGATKASTVSADAVNKQINSFNKTCSSLCTLIQNKRDEWRNEENSRKIAETSSQKETSALVAAISTGKGLAEPSRPPASMVVHQMRADLATGPAHPGMHPRAPTPTINMSSAGKMQQLRANARAQPYYRP